MGISVLLDKIKQGYQEYNQNMMIFHKTQIELSARRLSVAQSNYSIRVNRKEMEENLGALRKLERREETHAVQKTAYPPLHKAELVR